MPEQGCVGLGHDLALFPGFDLVTIDMRRTQVFVRVRAFEAPRLDVLDLPFLPAFDPALAYVTAPAMVAEYRGPLMLGE